ncbi:ribonuclease HII [Minwuia thermotolerans]|uniref:Ribonuclease HII n=1 Tax=Minwuia thermotolerans TaxID=2056226 RepID=A0A2M9G114_9PROT|nr:ribonuclease HII [Minwuia thermotolerans]PJK29408.1 ribonuclease HII [Minwuia thermotolerans]
MPDRMLETERSRIWQGPVAGVDEAGRGPIAGPVVAAAVILPEDFMLEGVNDSKLIAPAAREALALAIRAVAVVAVGQASVEEIDTLNILHAAMLAMQRAIEALPMRPAGVLVDGNRLPERLPCPGLPVIGGDGTELAIAAASIIAKTERDRMMRDLGALYPGYGLETHAGYATEQHRQAVQQLGPTPAHRRSFRPVRDMFT